MKLYNDHFQNSKRYNLPRAQHVPQALDMEVSA